MQTSGQAIIQKLADENNLLEIAFEVTLTGRSKEEPAKVSFTATSRVGYEVEFSRPVTEDLDDEVLQELIIAPFYTALERARVLVWGMGFPFAPWANKMPNIAQIKNSGNEADARNVKSPPAKKIKKRSTKSAGQKSS